MLKLTSVTAAAALLLAAAAQAQQAGGQGRPETAAGPAAQMMPGMPYGPHRRMMDDAWGGGAGPMMMGRGYHRTGPHMRMMMAMIDTDGSESLSLEEVQAVHARLFAYADADGDGELTMEEMRAFMRGDEDDDEE